MAFRFSPALPLQPLPSHNAVQTIHGLTATFQDEFNARMRHKLMLALTYTALLLSTLIIGIFHLNWFEPLFTFMHEHSEIEDPIMILIGCGLICTLAIMTIYITEVHALQRDISRIISEREETNETHYRRQKLESLGVIAAGISHEINTSLQSILGGCEMARTRITDKEACQQFLDRAIASSLHARRIIDNVLTFSSNGGTTRHAALSVTEVLADTATFCQTFLPASIEIKIDPPMPDFQIFIDRTGLMQAINNLVGNAAHATDFQGTVTLSCTTSLIAPPQAQAAGVPPGLYARIAVTDHGMGISEENLKRIFDPFFTTKKHGEGTGLGLSIVHGIVRGMNGFLDATSKLGQGSTFYIYLPLQSQPSKQ